MKKKLSQSVSKEEKDIIVSSWLLFRNEYNSLLKAGSKTDTLEAAQRGDMASEDIDVQNYVETQYASDYELIIDTNKPLIVTNSSGEEVLELSPDSNIHQLIGGEDIISHISTNGGVKIENLTDLKELDSTAYEVITRHNLDKRAQLETDKVVAEIDEILAKNDTGELDKTDIENLQYQIRQSLQQSLESGREETIKIPLTTASSTNESVKNEIDRSKYSVKFPEFKIGKYDVNLIADLMHNYEIFGHNIFLPSINIEAQKRLSEAVNKDGLVEINLATKQDILVGNISQDMLCQGNIVYVASPLSTSESDVNAPINKPSEKFNLSLVLPLIPLLLLKLRGKNNKKKPKKTMNPIGYNPKPNPKPSNIPNPGPNPIPKSKLNPNSHPNNIPKPKPSPSDINNPKSEPSNTSNPKSKPNPNPNPNDIPKPNPKPKPKASYNPDVTNIVPPKLVGKKIKNQAQPGKATGFSNLGQSGGGYQYKRKKVR